jgi:hypothetical protein
LVHEIFEPIIAAVEALVAEQVNRVKVKRMSENHPMGKEIKVGTSSEEGGNYVLRPINTVIPAGHLFGRGFWV